MDICNHFFVIHLEDDMSRRGHVEALQRALPFDLTIHPAIDGNRIPPSALRESLSTGEIDILSLRLHLGQLGCAFSHLRLWQRLLDLGLDSAVVLEDDARLTPDFSERYRALFAELPDDCDFLYLFTHPAHAQGMHDERLDMRRWQFIQRAHRTWGTVGYLITRHGAERLLESIFPINIPIDEVLMQLVAAGRIEAYAVKHCLVETDMDGPSNIWNTKTLLYRPAKWLPVVHRFPLRPLLGVLSRRCARQWQQWNSGLS
jgi:glycosyl transferase, family 25